MSQPAHYTPGPWHMDSIDQVRTETGIVIARCERNERHEYMDGKEQSANTRLIAAAPELLEELELQHDALMAERGHHMPILCPTCKLIAKAKGPQ